MNFRDLARFSLLSLGVCLVLCAIEALPSDASVAPPYAIDHRVSTLGIFHRLSK